MEYEELRPFILETLKREKETNIIKLLNAVEEYALSKGFFQECPEWYYSSSDRHKMPRNEREKARYSLGGDLAVRIIFSGSPV